MACVVVKNEPRTVSLTFLSNLESPARTVSSVAIVHHHHAVHARAVPSRTRTRARDNHIITHIHSLASRVARARVTRESIRSQQTLKSPIASPDVCAYLRHGLLGTTSRRRRSA